MSTIGDVGYHLALPSNVCSSKTLCLLMTEDLEFEEASSTLPHNWEWLVAQQHVSVDISFRYESNTNRYQL
jgi:hypothetical protein